MGWFKAAAWSICVMGTTCAHAQDCEQPNVIITLDRSGSMLQDGKWETATEAIVQLTRTFEHRIRFGMSVFPWREGCAVDRPDALLAEIAPFNGPAIQRALSGFGVRPQRMNLTPIAAATAGATSDLRALNDLDRRNFVVLLTDGMETCDGDPVQAAQNAFMQNYPVFVIGFGGGVDRGALNRMAVAGGTERAFQANNGRELFEAFNVIADAATQEVCDGKDNDCDGLIDEGLPPVTCETDCGTGEQICIDGLLSECRGGDIPEEVCGGGDDDCDTRIDEEILIPCVTISGNPGTHPCVDGVLAEDCVPDEAFREERCDDVDNDEDGRVDENQDVPCMVDCHAGRRICVRGSLTRCTGIDDDCDGMVDEGAECGGASICLDGACLQPCAQGECPDATTCLDDGYCHPEPCAPACGAGQVCLRTVCRQPCVLDQDCPEGVCQGRLCDGEAGGGGAGGFRVPPPVITEPDAAPPTEPAPMATPSEDAGGCHTVPGSTPGWLLLCVLGLIRRRR
jgi:hypothetical protein